MGCVGEPSKGDWTTASSCQSDATESAGLRLWGSAASSQARLCLLRRAPPLLGTLREELLYEWNSNARHILCVCLMMEIHYL